MSTETSCHLGHLLPVLKKNLFEIWFYTFFFFFHDFIHVYSPGAGADNPMGTKFWSQQEHLVTSVICCKFKKKKKKKNLFEIWFYTFFHGFIHIYIAPGQGRQAPGDKVLMSTEMSCHFIHLLEVSKNVFEVWFYTFFFSLIHVYSPGAGADSSQGTKFWCQQKGLITLPICCKFQRNLFEVWFYTIFSWFNTCILPRGSGHAAPWGQSFDVNRNFLSLRSSVASFKS